MTDEIGLGFGKRKLIEEIILKNWDLKRPYEKRFNYNELLFVIQEMLDEEGKKYFERRVSRAGHKIFKHFVQHLLYRNIANYDSMILITSEKGCITGDALLEMPRDLKKYPKGIPLKELEGKGPIYVYSFNKKTQKLELKKSNGVEFVKEDDVWEVELIDGRKISGTSDHPILLTDGTYCQIKDLIWNKKINKYCFNKNKERITTSRIRMWNRRENYKHIDVDYNIKNNTPSILEHRFIMKQLGYDINKMIVHHIDKNRKNNSINNLEVMSQANHIKTHSVLKDGILVHPGWGNGNNKGKKYNMNRPQYKIGTEERILHLSKVSNLRFNNYGTNRSVCRTKAGGVIKSIKYIGKRKVFDVVNVREHHNFIVNGFVVSNTGKSSAAIMMARAWCLMLGIRFSPERHIAYNNADVMRKIDQLNKFEPIVCVTGNSKIMIEKDGKYKSVMIKHLVDMKDYKVLGYNIKKKIFEYQKPTTGAIYNKKDIVYEVELENGIKINATKEHKFLTKNRGYIKLEELKESDEVISYSKKCVVCNKEFFPPSFRIEITTKIKKITKKGERKVYDIVGMPNGNFVCNYSPVIKNCDEAIRFACLVGSTKIKTSNSLIPIKKLEGMKKFKVYTFNEKTKKEEIQLAEKCIKVREDIVYEIETTNGKKIQATKEHKFLTKMGWKQLKELNNEDELIEM